MTRTGAPGPNKGQKTARRKTGQTPSNPEASAKAAPRRARKPATPEPVVEPVVEAPADSVEFAPVRSVRRGRAGMIVAAGIVIACGASAAVGLGKAMDGNRHTALKPASTAQRLGNQVAMARALPSEAPAEATELADYAPPDRDQVRRAYDDVGKVYGSEGLSGVVRLGMDCYANLESRPSYGQLDYCLAYDAFGAALQRHVTGGQALPANTWFAGSGPRGLSAATKVVGRDGDPSARLFDVQRLAGEVSHEGPGARDEAETTVASVPVQAAPQADPEGAPTAAPALAAAPATLVRASAAAKPASGLRPALKAEPAKLTKAKVAKPAADKPLKPAKAAPAKPQKAAKIEKASAKTAKTAKPAKLEKAKAKARRPGPLARLERAAVKARDAVFKPKPKITRASAPKAKAKPVKAPERVSARKKPRLVQTSTGRKPAQARVQKASTPKRRAREYRDGLPVIDCRRPIGRSEKEICQSVRVADRGRRDSYPAYEPDGDGTLGGQYERWRGRD